MITTCTISDDTKKNVLSTPIKKKDYILYQSVKLPVLTMDSTLTNPLYISAQDFINTCLDDARLKNDYHLKAQESRSNHYFTNLAQRQHTRIPKAIRRSNTFSQDDFHGLIGLLVYKEEDIKNTVLNRRVSSIKTHILTLDRVVELILPYAYVQENWVHFSHFGDVRCVQKEEIIFIKVRQPFEQERAAS